MYLFSKLWYQGCLKIRSDYIELNCVDLSNIKGLKCDKFWIIYSRILQVPQTLWRLLSNCWRLRFFFRAFSNVWNQPIFHDAAKTVQIGMCQLRMIFVSSQGEYKRDKRESILRCTDDADQGFVTFCTSSIAFLSRRNLVFHVLSDEKMYSPCGLLVLQIFPAEERTSTWHQSGARLWKLLLVLKSLSGASVAHQKGSLCGSWCTPKAVQRVRTPGAELQQPV